MTSRDDFFAELRAGQASYRPCDEVAEQLRDKTLLMLVGPTSIGKSTVMNAAVKLDSRLHRVSGFTSREPRANDEPDMYRYVSTDADYDRLKSDIENGILVQYMIHPMLNTIYGTTIQDYKGEFNMKDTISSSVEEDEQLSFKKCIPIGVIALPDDWVKWFAVRFQPGDPEVTKRLREAEQSLTWLLEHKDQVIWLQNDDLDAAAQRLSDICSECEKPFDGSELAQAMLDTIPELQKRFA
jgi:guanylate kinase